MENESQNAPLRGFPGALSETPWSPSQSAISLSELRVVLPLIVLALETPTRSCVCVCVSQDHLHHAPGEIRAVFWQNRFSEMFVFEALIYFVEFAA